MYAVITDGAIHYLGNDVIVAGEVLEQVEGKSRRTLVSVSTLEELASIYSNAQADLKGDPKIPDIDEDIADITEGLSEAAQRVIDYLNEAGLNAENAERISESVVMNSKATIAEVRSLGIKGMKTVGDRFLALGELIRKAAEDEAHEKEESEK